MFMVTVPVRQCLGVNSSKFNFIIRPIALLFPQCSLNLRMTAFPLTLYYLFVHCFNYNTIYVYVRKQFLSRSFSWQLASARMYRTTNQITYIPFNFTKIKKKRKKEREGERENIHIFTTLRTIELVPIRQQQHLTQLVSATQKISTMVLSGKRCDNYNV